MIHNYDQIKVERSNRLNSKTVQGLFFNLVYQGVNCSEFESRLIAQYAQTIFDRPLEQPQQLKAGQLCIVGVEAGEPAGKPIDQCKLKQAVVTLDGGQEDQQARLNYDLEGPGTTALRHPPSKIAKDIYHSLTAVERYITHFARINFLSREKGMTPQEIAFTTKLSLPLVKEYLQLCQEMDTPENRERLTEILQIAKPIESDSEVRPPPKKSGERRK